MADKKSDTLLSGRVRLSHTCPHCGSPVVLRGHSDQITPTVREIDGQCINTRCGFTGVVQIAWVRTLAPAMDPNPRAYIPMSPQQAKKFHPPDQPQAALPMDYPSMRPAAA